MLLMEKKGEELINNILRNTRDSLPFQKMLKGFPLQFILVME